MPTISLPLPPSVNHMYITTRTGRRIRTQEAIAWQDAALLIAKAVRRKSHYEWGGGWVRVTVAVTWPDHRRRDVSNLHKPLADCIEGAAYPDDKWALLHDDIPRYDKAHPHVELTWEAEA